MTNFVGDPRVRDAEEHAVNTTNLGPNFPGSLNDLWRMVFRPSQAFLRYVKLAVSNDDGSGITAKTDALLAELSAKIDTLQEALMPLTSVSIDGIVTVGGKTIITPAAIPPGMAPAVAYAALDAIGQPFSFEVPVSGFIQSAIYYDRDDEGLQVDLWLFEEVPPQQTDNSAFALSDAQLLTALDVLQFTTFYDGTNGQLSRLNSLGLAYDTSHSLTPGRLWASAQARGALNIAAANLPAFRLVILSD